jgi:hypothetical protein
MPSRLHEITAPERRDTQYVFRFNAENLVTVTMGARQQLFAGVSGGNEISAREIGDRQRSQERR